MSPKEQCEILLDALLPFAEDQLKKHREFYPIAAVLRSDDSVELTDVFDGSEHPDTKDVLDSLVRLHRQAAAEGEIKASGIAWNASVRLPEGRPSDGIVIRLEHQDDYSVIVVKPYKIGLFKKVCFGNLFAVEGKHDIFSKKAGL